MSDTGQNSYQNTNEGGNPEVNTNEEEIKQQDGKKEQESTNFYDLKVFEREYNPWPDKQPDFSKPNPFNTTESHPSNENRSPYGEPEFQRDGQFNNRPFSHSTEQQNNENMPIQLPHQQNFENMAKPRNVGQNSTDQSKSSQHNEFPPHTMNLHMSDITRQNINPNVNRNINQNVNPNMNSNVNQNMSQNINPNQKMSNLGQNIQPNMTDPNHPNSENGNQLSFNGFYGYDSSFFDAQQNDNQNSHQVPIQMNLNPMNLTQGNPNFFRNGAELFSGRPFHDMEQPLYVNAHQFNCIRKRKMRRDFLDSITASKNSLSYLHESRHRHAMNRLRAPSGRFLTKEEAEEMRAREKQGEEKPNEKQ